MWWSVLLGRLFGMGEGWLEAKNKQATAKVEAETEVIVAKAKSKVTIAEKDAEAANDIDLITVKNKNETYMDNFVILTFLGTYIAMFIPPLQPYVAQGFENFKDAPEWFQYIMYGIVISELGLRRMFMRAMDAIITMRTGVK